jgi:vitamin B12 transport system permease protein
MPLANPVSAGPTTRRTQVVYYAARRAGTLVSHQACSDQVGIAEHKGRVTDDRLLRHVMMAALPDGQTHAPSRPAVSPPMSMRNVLLSVFALFSTAMLGLAAGAVWMVVSLYLRHPLPWLVLPIGALLAWTIRSCVRPAGIGAAWLAASATALAAIYVNMLIAAVLIAGNMGMGLIDAIRTAGNGMLWQLARMALSPTDIGWLVLAMLLAAWLAWRAPRKR